MISGCDSSVGTTEGSPKAGVNTKGMIVIMSCEGSAWKTYKERGSNEKTDRCLCRI